MAEVGKLVDHLFRHQYGRMVAGLTRVFGSDQLDLVEDTVQEALLRALGVWPFEGVPERPEAWLVQVARNLAVDALRRRANLQRKQADLEQWAARATAAAPAAAEVADDSLRLMFTCCHPSLSAESRVALTLKTLCGFGVAEIARALVAKEATVAQRLTRAKAQLQRSPVPFVVPPPDELDERLDSVLDVLYLLFNEGYAASSGENLLRTEMLTEAIRLCDLLLGVAATRQPKVHALLALMLLQGARWPARTDPLGEPLTLAQQDRRLWDRRMIALGLQQLDAAIAGDVVSPFHLEAAIASCHASAPTYAATDWATILGHYDRLCALTPSPVARLNRAIAVAKVEGLEAGRAALAALAGERSLAGYYLLPASCAWLAWQAGDRMAAVAGFRAALACPVSPPERQFLRNRLARCLAGDAPGAF